LRRLNRTRSHAANIVRVPHLIAPKTTADTRGDFDIAGEHPHDAVLRLVAEVETRYPELSRHAEELPKEGTTED
jgi:hypothetical protein